MTVGLRQARAQDVGLLFDFVNRPDCLAAKAKTQGLIDWPDHQVWFENRLNDPASFLYIVEDAGNAIGQVRLQADDDGAYQVDIYIAPDQRGQGRACQALIMAIDDLAQRQPDAKVVAVVRLHNKASQALFKKAGFIEAAADDQFVRFDRKALA